jgi:hypothetical protein
VGTLLPAIAEMRQAQAGDQNGTESMEGDSVEGVDYSAASSIRTTATGIALSVILSACVLAMY